MLHENKKKYILKLLREKSFVTVAELSEYFKQSQVTIRKLLTSMENEGLLKRSWGGAVNASSSLVEYSHEEKTIQHLKEKKAIALEAYKMIHEGEAIFLDSGTTTLQLARLLAKGEKKNILVCTNAINIAMEFLNADGIHVIVIGGELRKKIMSCTGLFAIESLKQLHFDKCFITGNHFTLEKGYTTPVPSESEFKHALVNAGKMSIVLMDYSKYGDNSLALICPIEDIDYLITDYTAPSQLKTAFAERNAKVIIAPENVE